MYKLLSYIHAYDEHQVVHSRSKITFIQGRHILHTTQTVMVPKIVNRENNASLIRNHPHNEPYTIVICLPYQKMDVNYTTYARRPAHRHEYDNVLLAVTIGSMAPISPITRSPLPAALS